MNTGSYWTPATKPAREQQDRDSSSFRLPDKPVQTRALDQPGHFPGLGLGDRRHSRDLHQVALLASLPRRGRGTSACGHGLADRGCITRRSTRTVTVFCILLLTTRPVSCAGLRQRAVASASFSAAFAFSFMMVRTRAMSRLHLLQLAGVGEAAAWRPACAGRTAPAAAPSSSFCSSSPFLPRNSLGFIGSFSLSAQHALHDDGAERQLGRGERERLLAPAAR